MGWPRPRAVLDVYEREDVIGTLWKRGKQLHEGFNAHSERLGLPARFVGASPVGQLVFDHPDAGRLFLRFNEEVLKQGIIIYSVCYTNFSHSEADIDEAVRVMGEALEVIANEGLFDGG